MKLSLVVLLCGIATSCSDEPVAPGLESWSSSSAGFEHLLSGLNSVTDVAAEASGGRMLLTEQDGLLRIAVAGILLSEPALDLSAVVQTVGIHGGLMRVILAPDHATTGHFLLSYFGRDGRLHVDRYVLETDRETVEPGSVVSILSVQLPSPGAIGGALAIGPDGMLYVGIGDGGTPESADSAQDLTSLLGSVLRLDVGGTEGYTVPAGNPHLGDATARPEIWAHGVHDPRSIAFDAASGLVYVFDSGAEWQELNVQPSGAAGADYGWPVLDGSRCFRSQGACDREGRVLPVLEYGPNAMFTGVPGTIYEGTAIPQLEGHYIWADLWAGWVRSLQIDGGEATQRTEWILPVRPARWMGIVEAAGGELLIFGGANVYRLVPDRDTSL